MEDDEPISKVIEKRKEENNKASPAVKRESNATSTDAKTKATKNSSKVVVSDSEDDLPLVDFVNKRKREAGSSKVAKKISNSSSNNSSREKAPPAQDKEPALKARSSKSTDFYLETAKGKLVQTLLLRWWYAYDWPKPSEIGVPPPGYEALDGFAGVFVSTREDSLGQILDMRDRTNCPCLVTFARKSSADLRALCATALENQMKELREHEGDDCKLLATLQASLAEVRRVDTAQADREARPYDSAFGAKAGVV